MSLLGKIISALLTTLYSVTMTLTLYSIAQRLEEPILSYAPWFFTGLLALTLGLFVFYCNHLAENETLGRFPRILWFIRFFLLSFIAFPFYWVVYVMREEIEN